MVRVLTIEETTCPFPLTHNLRTLLGCPISSNSVSLRLGLGAHLYQNYIVQNAQA